MRFDRARVGQLLLVAGGVGSSAAAFAGPGDGIELGPVELHPSVNTAIEYRSNVFLAAGDYDPDVPGVEEPVVGAPIWTIHPRLMARMENQWLELDVYGDYYGRKYIDTKPNDSSKVANLDRFSDFDLGFSLIGLKDRLVGFKLADTVGIDSTPASVQKEDAAGTFVHTSNDLEGLITVRPGSALDLDAGGHLSYDKYDVPGVLANSDEAQTYNGRLTYGPSMYATWRFLPKTALVGMVSGVWTDWQRNSIESLGLAELDQNTSALQVGDFIGKPNSAGWRTRWGMRGQITSKIGLGAELGYGQLYYDEATLVGSAAAGDAGTGYEADLTSFGEGLLVSAQALYTPYRGHTFTIGYLKDFQDATFTNYTAYNYAFIRYDGKYFGKLTTTLEASYRHDAYVGEVSRNDETPKARLQLSYDLTKFLAVTGGGAWTERACAGGFLTPTAGDACQGAFHSIQYDDFSANLGVTLSY